MYTYCMSAFICFCLGVLIGVLFVPSNIGVGIVLGIIFAVVGVCVTYKFEHEDDGDIDDVYERKMRSKGAPENNVQKSASQISQSSPRVVTSVKQIAPSKSWEYVQEDVEALICVCEQQYNLAQNIFTTIWKCDSGSVSIFLMTDRIYVVISSDDKKHITDRTINASNFTNYNIVFTKIAKPVFKELAKRYPDCEITNSSICIKVKSTEKTPSTKKPDYATKQICTPKTTVPAQSPSSARLDASQLSKKYMQQADVEALIKICEQFYKETREYLHMYRSLNDKGLVTIGFFSDQILFLVHSKGLIRKTTYYKEDLSKLNTCDFRNIAEPFFKALTIKHPNWNANRYSVEHCTFEVKY